MNQKTKTFTYQEYLERENELEVPYELIDGEIVEMPPESYQNVQIALILMALLADIVGWSRISNKTEIVVSGSKVTSRIPDVTVLSEEGVQEVAAKNTSIIDMDMLPPLLVIEVVSPGKEARDRDYRYKKVEYAARKIQHYWIVDPGEKKFTAFDLVDGIYEWNTLQSEGALELSKPFDISIDLDALFLDRPKF